MINVDLHVSMINHIKVYQVGDSKLSATNKSQQKADVHKGKNKKIDLGKGVQHITTTIKVLEEHDFNSLYKIIANKRKGTITDRFLGVIKVAFESYTIIHSDSELGVTTIDLNMTIEENFNPRVNYSGKVDKMKHEIKDSMKDDKCK